MIHVVVPTYVAFSIFADDKMEFQFSDKNFGDGFSDEVGMTSVEII